MNITFQDLTVSLSCEIPVTSPLLLTACVSSRISAEQFEIAAVDSHNLESSRVRITIP